MVRRCDDASLEKALRAGHPEPFINHPVNNCVEVIENIRETDLPWHSFYLSLDADADLPSQWDETFPIHFVAEIVDGQGVRVGYSMRELRDADDGLRMKLTSHLLAAAPRHVLDKHLHHLSIEYRNWARFA